MKLTKFNIGANIIKIERNFLGTEYVYLNDSLSSRKRTLFGTTHNLKIDGIDYSIKYTVKDWFKNWTGKPAFELISGERIVSEHKITNSLFFSMQFMLSLVIFYAISLVLWMFIESAKRGFVLDAY